MLSINVMAWNGRDLEKLEVLQNRLGPLALGTPKWMAVEAVRGDLGWSLFSYGENQWNARCFEGDSGMRYLVGREKECSMTVMDEINISWCMHGISDIDVECSSSVY
ncbi:hypothetical protein FHG87_021188 [Trinorchestia longiramus]|nr:hypothetical protein FHG87_021188 [Trinorchestia longiramus]